MVKKTFSDSPCICLQVRKADRHLTRIYDALLRPGSIRITQYGLLFCIDNLDEPSIAGIGKALSMDQTTVTRNIMKLETMGLVETVADALNRQKKLVTLTAAGRKALSDSQKDWEAAQKYVRECLGDSDYALLLRLMAKIAAIPEK